MNNIKQLKSKAIAGGMILSLLTASSLFTFSSCADDHFDVRNDIMGSKTLWENINENEQLSEYAYILKNVPYSQSENKFSNETYAQVLSGEQTFTIWAPKNGSFNFEYYKSLIETGTKENLKRVEQELIRNNMTRYTNIMNRTDSVKLTLFNEKTGWLNYTNNTFKGQQIIKNNIGSSNGVLHITASAAPYEYNIYEYITSNPELDSLNRFLKTYNVERFSESASIQGPTVDGQVTWVDSVTYTMNDYLLGYHGIDATEEDSCYVMIMPTNKAWQTAYDKAKGLFEYKTKYVQDVNTQTETLKDTVIKGATTTFTEQELDSIKKFRINNAICQGLIFNGNWQPEQVKINSLSDLAKVDSLETVYGHKYKKTGTLNRTNDPYSTHEVDDYVTMFGGKEPIVCSNGYAYISETWNMPNTLIAPTLEFDAQVAYDSKEASTTIEYDKAAFEHYDSEGNSVSVETYPYLAIKGTSAKNGTAYFKLKNLLSCKYDIYVVSVFNNSTKLPTIFKCRLKYDKELTAKEQKYTTNFQNLFQNSEDSYGATSATKINFYTKIPETDTISTSPLKVDFKSVTDTIKICEDFEIPVCYYGLNNAYPVLEIVGAVSNTDVKNKLYAKELLINSIILKPKREE